MNRRQRVCGRQAISKEERVAIAVNEGVAHYRNLQVCGYVHTCPVCAPKIREARAQEIAVGLAVHRALNGGVEFVTVTLRHGRGDRLETLLDLVTGGWSAVVGSNGATYADAHAWADDRDMFGIVGFIRTLEVTVTKEGGWHPHLHVLVLTEKPLADWQRTVLADRLWGRWKGYVVRQGRRPPTRAHGLLMISANTVESVARYMSKVYDSLHQEMTRSDLKAGRKGRNPFKLLGDVVATGDRRDLDLWTEYEQAIKGKRFLVWSKGLKARLGVDEITDQQHAEATVGGVVVAALSQQDWLTIKRGRAPRGFMARLLDAAEAHGEAGVYELLACLPAYVAG